MSLSSFSSELFSRKGLPKNSVSPSDQVKSKWSASYWFPNQHQGSIGIMGTRSSSLTIYVYIKRPQKQFPLGNGIQNTTLPFPERPRYCNTIFKLQLKRLVKCRNRRYCCSHCEQLHQCPPFTTL